jgi:Listeria-Bacteroides repeat domain (List_Bact_rpt).
MKKKIALLLVAALISVGLVVSCSDDPAPAKPVEPEVTYTVVFDANGGTLADGTSIAVVVKEGEAVGNKWPEDDPVKTSVFDYGVIEDDFLGWFDGETKYTSTTKITKDVTLVAKYSPFSKPEREDKYYKALGWFTWENNKDTQRGWRANGADNVETDLAWEDIKEARYLVLHTKGGAGDNWATGFGGIQFVTQGDGSSWGWDQTNINSFYIPRGSNKDIFIAIDLTTTKNYSKLVKGSIGKFVVSYYDGVTNATGLGLQEAYLTNIDLKPSSSVLLGSNQNKIAGFATDADVLKLLGVTAPTDTKTVTYVSNYNTPGTSNAAPSPDAVKVATGAPLSLKYRDVSRPGFTFLGWFDGAAATISVAQQEATGYDQAAVVANWGTKYDPSTKVAADVTLSAGWEEQNWADIKNTIKKGDANAGSWAIDQNRPFKYFIVAMLNSGNADGFGGVQFQFNGGGAPGGQCIKEILTTGNWTGIAHTPKDIVYLVIDLSGFQDYDHFANDADVSYFDGWVQLRINYGGNNLGTYQGYVVKDKDTGVALQSLTKPADAVDLKLQGSEDKELLKGFVTKTLPAELK